MIRFVLRLCGLIVFAAGFVAMVIDGSRSVAGGAFLPASLITVLESLFPGFEKAVPEFLQSIGLQVMEGVLLWVLAYPASIILVMLGIILLWVGRKPRPPLGLQQA